VGLSDGVAVGVLHATPESEVIESVPAPKRESTLYTPIRTYPAAGYMVTVDDSLFTEYVEPIVYLVEVSERWTYTA
jgi:hypothetical protein